MDEAKEMILSDAVKVAIEAEHARIKLKCWLLFSIVVNITLLAALYIHIKVM